jgi:hypothetical protein
MVGLRIEADNFAVENAELGAKILNRAHKRQEA